MAKAKYTIETTTKKYSKLNGYQCRGRSRGSILLHLAFKFGLSEFEVKEAYRTGKLKII